MTPAIVETCLRHGLPFCPHGICPTICQTCEDALDRIRGCTLDQFEVLIGTLVRAGIIERPSPNTSVDVLRWVGA